MHWYSDFLKSLDDPNFFTQPSPNFDFNSLNTEYGNAAPSSLNNFQTPQAPFSTFPPTTSTINASKMLANVSAASSVNGSTTEEAHLNFKQINDTDKLAIVAADQPSGSRDERLARVIHAKFEAGLLKPFDYVSGYQRLMRWMESHVCLAKPLQISF